MLCYGLIWQAHLGWQSLIAAPGYKIMSAIMVE